MIPFSPPRIDQKIIDEVTDTLRSGWITTGPKTKRFEKELSAYYGAAATLCLNSATAGLELMLRWFGVGAGDEVILPAYTYSATANVIMHCGATPVFVDVADDFNIDINTIRRAITAKTKVIMPVDFAGFPCDYDLINELVKIPCDCPFTIASKLEPLSKHPLNFIEMSGELFDKTYKGGISIDSIAAKDYLNNTNRKLLYFILDYHQYEKSKTVAMGASQSNKLQAVLALLDQYGTLEHTDGIYIVVTKSDLFPYGVNQKEYAANFVKENFKGLITNCKNLQEKYRDRFKIIVYPFSIGDVRFQNMLVNINPESPEMVVEDIIQHSFMTTNSIKRKFFS